MPTGAARRLSALTHKVIHRSCGNLPGQPLTARHLTFSHKNREISAGQIGELIREITAIYPPRRPIDPESLADGFMSTFECAFILSKSLNEPDITVAQLLHYRNYVDLLCRPD